MQSGYFQEFFLSIQGAGLWAGAMHLFARLAGCRVGCQYCDTEKALPRPGLVQGTGASPIENPVSVEASIALLERLDENRPGAQALAVTGGEPLEQEAFLDAFLPEVKKKLLRGRPILLETSGLHPEPMGRLAGYVDMVSMDIKIHSTSGLNNVLSLHARFLEVVAKRPFYVKVVVNSRTTGEEIAETAMLVASRDPTAVFYIQPQTREGCISGGAYLLELWEAARGHLENVRVQPQLHRILDLA